MKGERILYCECEDDKCKLSVSLSDQEELKITQMEYVVIVNGCQNGPHKDYKFVEKRKGYSIYREKEEKAARE